MTEGKEQDRKKNSLTPADTGFVQSLQEIEPEIAFLQIAGPQTGYPHDQPCQRTFGGFYQRTERKGDKVGEDLQRPGGEARNAEPYKDQPRQA
jgi:hypothetical protein